MKQIIDKQLYDTDKAECLATWKNGHNHDDFCYMADSLYKTEKGNFFIHEEGGARTDRSAQHGNSSGWGERLRAVSKEEALAWCVEKGKVETTVKYFGDMVTEA